MKHSQLSALVFCKFTPVVVLVERAHRGISISLLQLKPLNRMRFSSSSTPARVAVAIATMAHPTTEVTDPPRISDGGGDDRQYTMLGLPI
jgi:hypothetical protein